MSISRRSFFTTLLAIPTAVLVACRKPFDANYDYEVFCPWEVVKTDLDALTTSIPQGVVVSTSITDDQFGIMPAFFVRDMHVDVSGWHSVTRFTP